MDIEWVAAIFALVGVLARSAKVWRKKEDLEKGAMRVAGAAGSAAAIFVGAVTGLSFIAFKAWPEFAAKFYGNWLSNPTFLLISGVMWAYGGVLGMSLAWKTALASSDPKDVK
ncbi:MAG: hypothetical protein JOZ24_01150 [Candidatus Eremiobacteraeota bacterium]|nr:hypothetical protein [Candidatus Eremiobacteraeota bacterium]